MTTPRECDCPGCVADDGCWWLRALWSPGLLDGVELPPAVQEVIQRLVAEDDTGETQEPPPSAHG